MIDLDFSYSQDELQEITTKILDQAINLGATSAQVEINEGITTGISVLNSEIESFETSYESAIHITTYVGQKCGIVAVSQINPQNLTSLIKRALEIAKYTQEDSANGIADKQFLCNNFVENLNLYNPQNLDNQILINKACDIEQLAIQQQGISNSDGASVNLGKSNFIFANSNGFNAGYKTTNFSHSISLIGKCADGSMQTDYWYDSKRDFNDLISNQELTNIATSRLTRRLNKGKINSGKYPIIFEASIAKSLIAHFLGAISGGNLYRRLSFLNDSINNKIFPNWVNISENPFINKGMASCYFDNEGVKVQERNIVESGIIKGYILSSYTARKLKLITTGNAGGYHNIKVSSNFNGNIEKLAQVMQKGLIVIETIGHGLNMVTGDYSVGASGLWVEGGRILHFVDNLTISGNLKQIYQDIQYISDDSYNSIIDCGSILVSKINVSA